MTTLYATNGVVNKKLDHTGRRAQSVWTVATCARTGEACIGSLKLRRVQEWDGSVNAAWSSTVSSGRFWTG